jgi:tetratricopeptide (TPR) repeat protein
MNLRALFAGLIVFWPALSLAETATDIDTCNDDDATIADRMKACSHIISDHGASSLGVAFRNRGNVYSEMGQYDLAIADETKAIELNPEDSEAYNVRAWAHLKSGEVKLALADANKAFAINDKQPDTLHTRGAIYEAMGMQKEAVDHYRQALAIDPSHHDSKESLERLGIK